MKKHFQPYRLPFAIWGLLLLTACHSDGSSSSGSQGSDTNTTVTSIRDGGYYHLKGTLADMDVTMELFEDDQALSDHTYFRGFYSYDRYGGPISLYGHLDESGTLTLTEQGGWEGESHELKGRWNPQKGFVGSWKNGNGQDVHPFNLQITTEDALQFSMAQYSDSLQAFPEWPVSPKLFYEVEWLQPKATSLPSRQQQFLENAITNGILNNNTAEEKATILEALNDRYSEISADFIEEMNSLRKEGFLDSQQVDDDGFTLNYSYNTSMQVYYNTTSLLTVGYTDYSYTGGAHGMYSTQVATYNLTDMKRLKIEDVLLPGYEQKVSEVLAKALRTKYGLTDNEPLSAILFDNTIMPNDNFGLTNKGVFFVYAPYEIAPYVVGEIELFVSFEKIQEFVREEWWQEEEEEEEGEGE